MRIKLSVLLGLMLLTSMVGISYATPILPTQTGGNANACAGLTPNDPNYVTLGCAGAAHQGGNENPPHGCIAPVGRVSLDGGCCWTGRVGSDGVCCVNRVASPSLDGSNIQTDRPYCGPP